MYLLITFILMLWQTLWLNTDIECYGNNIVVIFLAILPSPKMIPLEFIGMLLSDQKYYILLETEWNLY